MVSFIYSSVVLDLIACETTRSNLSSISVLVSLTAFSRMTRQISINFSPSSSLSGILATASVITLDASGSRNASIIFTYNDQTYLEFLVPSTVKVFNNFIAPLHQFMIALLIMSIKTQFMIRFQDAFIEDKESVLTFLLFFIHGNKLIQQFQARSDLLILLSGSLAVLEEVSFFFIPFILAQKLFLRGFPTFFEGALRSEPGFSRS